MTTLNLRGEPSRNGLYSAQTAATAEPRNELEAFRQEVQRLTAENQQLMGMVAGIASEGTELEQLRNENEQLRAAVTELEQMLSGGGQASEWAEQQREYEALLEEKSEVIRSLHQKLQESRAEIDLAQANTSANNVSAEAVHDRQIQALKDELERQREQLEEDEEALMTQMRQMEMSMARERAEMARQRNELQRLHNDLKHEVEQASRDGPLRERLNSLQRRQPEAAKNGTTPPANPTPAPKNNGVLRRLFRPGT